MTFNAAGAVTAGTLQECNADVPVMPLVGGSLTVGANSSVSGRISVFDLQGTFLPVGDAFVAVSTVNSQLGAVKQAGPGSATPGVDFTPASGSVTFGPNDTRKTFTISARNDEITEEDESVALTLSVPVGAATLGRATTTLRIVDAPPPSELLH